MSISLNALLNKPTREEKSRKQLLDQQQDFAAGQSALDQSRTKERMSIADEMARGQMEFSKKLGIEFGQKEYDQARQNALRELTAAGETPDDANQKLGAARSADVQAGANKASEEKARGLLNIPGLRALFEAANIDTSTKETRNRGLLASGQEGIAYDLGKTRAESEIAEGKFKGAQAASGMQLLPQQQQTTAAELEQRQQVADEYKAAGGLRGLLNEIKLQEAQGRQGFLEQIANDPLYQAVIAGGLDPRAFGAGVAGPMGVGTLPLPGGKPAGILGGQMRQRKTAAEALEEALGGDVKLVQ